MTCQSIPLTNSASTLTPTPSMLQLYPQIQNSPDLLLQIPTHPQIHLPIPPSPTQREKNPKIPPKHRKENPEKFIKCRHSVIREDRTKNFNEFLLSLSHSFSPILFLFRFQFSLHFLCSQTSTGAFTKEKQQHSQQRRARIEEKYQPKITKTKGKSENLCFISVYTLSDTCSQAQSTQYLTLCHTCVVHALTRHHM